MLVSKIMPCRASHLLTSALRLVALSICVLIFECGTARESEAKAADPAELLIRKGVELRRQGKPTEALPKFQQAYELAHDPRSAAQLGLCEHALQSWEDANQHLAEALLAESNEWVMRNRAVLQNAQNEVRRNLGQITLLVEPLGVSVSINGTPMGRTPDVSSIWVVPGVVKIGIAKEGFRSDTVQRQITAGSQEEVRVTLSSAAPAPSPNVPTPSQVSELGSADTSAKAATSTGTQAGKYSLQKKLGFAALGLGLVSAGVFTYALLSRESAAKEFNTTDGCFKSGSGAVGGQACNDLDGTIRSRGRLALISGLSTAVSTVAGVALLLLDYSSQDHARNEGVACAPEARFIQDAWVHGIGCVGTF